MNCRSAEELFSSFVEDELSQRERRTLESHLEECTRCSVTVAELRATMELLTALPAMDTGPAFEEEVMDRIRSGEALRPSLVEWLSEHLAPARLRPVFLAGAAGCAVWIGVMIAGPFGQQATTVAHKDAAPTTVATAPVTTPAPTPTTPAGDVVATAAPTSTPHTATAPHAESSDRALAAGTDSVTAPYQDEYILDQFYLNRSGEEGVHSIVPVSGRPTDDVYITF